MDYQPKECAFCLMTGEDDIGLLQITENTVVGACAYCASNLASKMIADRETNPTELIKEFVFESFLRCKGRNSAGF